MPEPRPQRFSDPPYFAFQEGVIARNNSEPATRGFGLPSAVPTPRVSGTVLVLQDRWAIGTHVGHWFFTLLPNLALIEHLGLEFDKLYIPARTPFQREALGILGLEHKLI